MFVIGLLGTVPNPPVAMLAVVMVTVKTNRTMDERFFGGLDLGMVMSIRYGKTG